MEMDKDQTAWDLPPNEWRGELVSLKIGIKEEHFFSFLFCASASQVLSQEEEFDWVQLDDKLFSLAYSLYQSHYCYSCLILVYFLLKKLIRMICFLEFKIQMCINSKVFIQLSLLLKVHWSFLGPCTGPRFCDYSQHKLLFLVLQQLHGIWWFPTKHCHATDEHSALKSWLVLCRCLRTWEADHNNHMREGGLGCWLWILDCFCLEFRLKS